MQIHGWVVIIMEKLNFDAKLNKGSVLVIIAVLLPVFILLLGMIVDIGRALTYKEEINKACMIAAEEATKSIDVEAAENLGINVLNENFSDIIYEYFNKNYEDRGYCSINYLNYDIFDSVDNPKYIVVSCEAKVECFFLKIIGINDILIHNKAYGRLRRIK